MKVPFNRVTAAGSEMDYVKQAMDSGKLSGDGPFARHCEAWLEKWSGARRAMLTPSCTAALEMAALLCEIEPGDEVIMPSYTFPSTANAFALRGARIVFVDVKPQTMNLNGALLAQALTARTRAIVVVHYGGFSCDMDPIMEFAFKHGLFVIEDAAQGLMSSYKGRPLGSMGHFGAISFHETKNVQCGEGGTLLINDSRFIERAEIVREKGTNRSKFFRGEIDKYGWVGPGSSYLLGELSAAYLLGQLERAEEITGRRREIWQTYYDHLWPLTREMLLTVRSMPAVYMHNGHCFYIKVRDIEERDRMIAFLKDRGIGSAFHFLPLHSSAGGVRYGRMAGADEWTTKESERLLRLPIYPSLTPEEQAHVIRAIYAFYGRESDYALAASAFAAPSSEVNGTAWTDGSARASSSSAA